MTDLQPNSVHLLSCTYLINLNWKKSLPTFKNKSRSSAEYCINKGLISFLLFFKKKAYAEKNFTNDLSAWGGKKKEKKSREHGGSLLGFFLF